MMLRTSTGLATGLRPSSASCRRSGIANVPVAAPVQTQQASSRGERAKTAAFLDGPPGFVARVGGYLIAASIFADIVYEETHDHHHLTELLVHHEAEEVATLTPTSAGAAVVPVSAEAPALCPCPVKKPLPAPAAVPGAPAAAAQPIFVNLGGEEDVKQAAAPVEAVLVPETAKPQIAAKPAAPEPVVVDQVAVAPPPSPPAPAVKEVPSPVPEPAVIETVAIAPPPAPKEIKVETPAPEPVVVEQVASAPAPPAPAKPAVIEMEVVAEKEDVSELSFMDKVAAAFAPEPEVTVAEVEPQPAAPAAIKEVAAAPAPPPTPAPAPEPAPVIEAVAVAPVPEPAAPAVEELEEERELNFMERLAAAFMPEQEEEPEVIVAEVEASEPTVVETVAAAPASQPEPAIEAVAAAPAPEPEPVIKAVAAAPVEEPEPVVQVAAAPAPALAPEPVIEAVATAVPVEDVPAPVVETVASAGVEEEEERELTFMERLAAVFMPEEEEQEVIVAEAEVVAPEPTVVEAVAAAPADAKEPEPVIEAVASADVGGKASGSEAPVIEAVAAGVEAGEGKEEPVIEAVAAAPAESAVSAPSSKEEVLEAPAASTGPAVASVASVEPSVGLEAVEEAGAGDAGVAEPSVPVMATPAAQARMAVPASGFSPFTMKCSPLDLPERMVVFGDLGGYTHESATASPDAQRLIDEGLVLAYNFNQVESKRTLEAALQVEEAPMAYWGLAYANGPFLNKTANPMPADMSYAVFTQEELEAGRKAIDTGLALVDAKLSEAQANGDAQTITLLERDQAYLKALAPVFHAETPYGEPWRLANTSFATSMEAWAEAHPEDVDAWALASEAWANMQAWDYWDTSDPENPQPKGRTTHIIELAQKALAQYPGHPLAAHMMVHATEAGGAKTAALAVPAARALGASNPSMGHLVHMASHTYLRVGLWHDGVEANLAALELDLAHGARCMEPDMPFHNAGMGTYAASTAAEKGNAIQMASALAQYPAQYGPMYMTDGRDRVALPLTLLRFADWEGLANVAPGDVDPLQDGLMMLPPGASEFSKSLVAYFDAMGAAAHAAGATDPEAAAAWRSKAIAAEEALRAAIQAQPEDPVTLPGTGLGIYSPGFKAVASHHDLVARARLAVLDGDWAAATQLLSEAWKQEFAYGYMEPPRFPQPQGECLGWVLLKQGRYAEAAEAYQQVLREYPVTPWALTGLQDVYSAIEAAGASDTVALPAGLLSKQEVASLLAEADSASKGQAVKLPSSCPAFSEPAEESAQA